MVKTPKPRQKPLSRAVLHIAARGGTLAWIAEDLMDPPMSVPYLSRQMSGEMRFSDTLFTALVKGFGAEEAIVIRDIATEDRAKREMSS